MTLQCFDSYCLITSLLCLKAIQTMFSWLQETYTGSVRPIYKISSDFINLLICQHNNDILDVLLANHPDLFHVLVEQSLIKTKHKALIVNAMSLTDDSVLRGSRRRVQV